MFLLTESRGGPTPECFGNVQSRFCSERGRGGAGNDAEDKGGEGDYHLKMRRLNLINP